LRHYAKRAELDSRIGYRLKEEYPSNEEAGVLPVMGRRLKAAVPKLKPDFGTGVQSPAPKEHGGSYDHSPERKQERFSSWPDLSPDWHATPQAVSPFNNLLMDQ
jgi:hypothetical protein